MSDPQTRPKVLIIDDARTIREMLRMTLGELHCECQTADNGVKGLEAWRAFQPGIIFTDWNMPDMDGLSMVKQIRFEDSKTRIVMLTTHDDPEKMAEAKAAGVSFFMVKPPTAEKIAFVLKAALAAQSADELEFEVFAEGGVINPRSALLVDDSRTTQAAVTEVLKELGLMVLKAKDGRDGFRLYRELRPKLVISDLEMPDGNGLQLLAAVRRVNSAVPFVIMTGNQSPEPAEQGKKLGVTQWVIKPFTPDKIRETVARLLDKTPVVRAAGAPAKPAAHEWAEVSEPLRVLIVDDAATIRAAASAAVEAIGCTVQVAKDGEDGLKAYASFKPHVILSDWEMPHVNGLEFLTRVRETNKTIPFVLVTSLADREKVLLARKMNVSGYIVKPFKEAALQEMVAKLGATTVR